MEREENKRERWERGRERGREREERERHTPCDSGSGARDATNTRVAVMRKARPCGSCATYIFPHTHTHKSAQ